jgi:hypothetical protein
MSIEAKFVSRPIRCAAWLAAMGGLVFCSAPSGHADTDANGDGDGATGPSAGAGAGSAGSGAGSSSGAGGGTPVGCLDGDAFAIDAMKADSSFLASDALEGRAPATPGDEQTRQLIAERFSCLGLKPAGSADSYHQLFVSSAGKATGNVVALLAGSDPGLAHQIIVVGAHHDHLGVINGEIYNGANDNASGVVAMLALAKAMQQAPPPRRTVVFVAFGSEEHELDGSHYFVDVAPPAAVPIVDIVHMVNLDMIGTYAMAGSVDAFGTYAGSPGLIVLQSLFDDYPTLDFNLGGSGEGASDYHDFCEQDIPYIYFETWDEECYHEPCDDADRVDYPGLSTIAKLSFDITTTLANTDMDLVAAREDLGCPE